MVLTATAALAAPLQEVQLIASAESDQAYFGQGLGLVQNDEHWLVVGDYYDNLGTGALFLYPLSDTGLSPTAMTIPYPGSSSAPAFGLSFAVLEDADGDDVVDLLVGAPSGATSYGEAYLYTGQDLTVPPTRIANPSPSGTDTLAFGRRVVSVGDLNADGFGDAVVGTYIWIHVFLGDGDSITHWGAYVSDRDVAGVGDVDGDGYSDLALSGNPDAARLYLGSAEGPAALQTYADLGTQPPDGPVAGLGDIDGDGFDDVAFASRQLVYVGFGGPDGLDDWVTEADDPDIRSMVGLEDGLIAVSRISTNYPWPDTGLVQFYETDGRALVPVAELESEDCTSGLLCFGDVMLLMDIGDDGLKELAVSATSGVYILSEGDCLDYDQDGDCAMEDCDDADPQVFTGAEDPACDGVDGDCDGRGGPDDDEDADGLSWTEEAALGTSPCDPDSDGDGIPDGEDPTPNGEPTQDESTKDWEQRPSAAQEPRPGCATGGGFRGMAWLAVMALGLRRRRRR